MDLRTLRFGIEIETVGLSRAKLAEAVLGVVGGTVAQEGNKFRIVMADGRTWSVVPDGSLSGGYDQSGELVSPILEYSDIEQLQNIVRAVRGAGARVDSSTGIHIHLGAEHFDARSLTNLVKMVHKQERLLEHALGVSQARLNRYCQPINQEFMHRLESGRPRSIAQVNEAWYGQLNRAPNRYDSSRYHGLNLNSLFVRGTIEFRYFNGTLHAGEIKAYVQLVLALGAKALKATKASSRRRDFNVASAKYDMRVLLLDLGMIGDEFKTARQHLTKKLAGSAAWKGERRDRRARTPVPAPTDPLGGAWVAA